MPELIRETADFPVAGRIPATRQFPIHLSVPIRLSNGSVYGTFCCFSYVSDPSLGERDLQMLRAFTELVAQQIEIDLHRSA